METIPTKNERPAGTQEVFLVDAKWCAAAGSMSLSTWKALVRQGVAPQPFVQFSRYTRWRMADVRDFFSERGALRSFSANESSVKQAKQVSESSRPTRFETTASNRVAA